MEEENGNNLAKNIGMEILQKLDCKVSWFFSMRLLLLSPEVPMNVRLHVDCSVETVAKLTAWKVHSRLFQSAWFRTSDEHFTALVILSGGRAVRKENQTNQPHTKTKEKKNKLKTTHRENPTKKKPNPNKQNHTPKKRQN